MKEQEKLQNANTKDYSKLRKLSAALRQRVGRQDHTDYSTASLEERISSLRNMVTEQEKMQKQRFPTKR